MFFISHKPFLLLLSWEQKGESGSAVGLLVGALELWAQTKLLPT